MPEFPSMVPYGADQTLYLVVEACGTKGPAHQTAVERTNLEIIITDLLSGRFDNPIGILAFNTLEHWTDDMSEEVAREIQCRCDIEGDHVPEYLAEFIGIISAQAPLDARIHAGHGSANDMVGPTGPRQARPAGQLVRLAG